MNRLTWRRWNGDTAERRVPEEPWEWVGLGVAPVPKGKLRVFLYHLGNGLVMGYPIPDIIAFCLKNRDSFGAEWRERRKADFLEDGYLS